MLLIGPLRTNFSEILIEISLFSFKEMHLKMLSDNWRPFCLGLNVLKAFFHYSLFYFDYSSAEVCSRGTKWQQGIIGSSNGLVQIRKSNHYLKLNAAQDLRLRMSSVGYIGLIVIDLFLKLYPEACMKKSIRIFY